MKRIRVVFPYVEAGFGHIMPMKSIVQTFQKKYGDKVEVIPSNFFTETGDSHLIRYEQMLARQVRLYNAHPFIGHIATMAGEFFGTVLTTFGCVKLPGPIACRLGIKHMKELAPDVVFSTHWVTNYYAEHLKGSDKPLTVMYCPDARLNKLFSYRCDLNMISMPYGYQQALRKKRYNADNMKLVPFLIRNEAFDVLAAGDKKYYRKKLGIPEDNFTVLLAEGGYGIGKMAEICKRLIKEHIPITVIPVCGKNKKLYKRFCAMQPTSEVTFMPFGFTEDILMLDAASDLFLGKSGNILAEATFFGNPSIVTNCSTLIERYIADHYINTVGCAVKKLSPKKTVELIRSFVNDPSLLEPYKKAAEAYHDRFGSERAADVLWERIVDQFPELSENGANDSRSSD